MLAGAGLQDYGFTGREFDAETGLCYFRARHYDPEAGRFLQSDPLGFAAGDLNLYAYTWNDPANWTDPSGLAVAADAATTTGGSAGLAASTYRVGTAALCLAGKVSTALTAISDIVENGLGTTNITLPAAAAGSCRTRAKAPCPCKAPRNKALAALLQAMSLIESLSSFPEGTEVLTPDGPVAIETLRAGDLVIGRDEETGQSGVFPVTALMTRQALDTLWLTLEKDGETTRMGVTSQHPLFVAGEGWIVAGELVPGDVVRDSALQSLRVLSVELDSAPTRVHNLEVAGAHTYFAGALEAWGHNAIWNLQRFVTKRLKPEAKNCNGAARGPDGRFEENPKVTVEEGNVVDGGIGVVSGLFEDDGGLCPNNRAGRQGKTIGTLIKYVFQSF